MSNSDTSPSVSRKESPTEYVMTKADWLAFKMCFDLMVGVSRFGAGFLKGIVVERGTFRCPECGVDWVHRHNASGDPYPVRIDKTTGIISEIR